MDVYRDTSKSGIRKILSGSFRRGVARKADVSKGTPSSTYDENGAKETKDEKIFSHSGTGFYACIITYHSPLRIVSGQNSEEVYCRNLYLSKTYRRQF